MVAMCWAFCAGSVAAAVAFGEPILAVPAAAAGLYLGLDAVERRARQRMLRSFEAELDEIARRVEARRAQRRSPAEPTPRPEPPQEPEPEARPRRRFDWPDGRSPELGD